MSRDLSTGLLSTLDDNVIYPFFAIELKFDDNIIRTWSGLGTLVYNSVEWVGTGELLSISSIEETSEIAVKGATITMSGIPSELLSLAIGEPYQGRECVIYFGTFDKTQTVEYQANGFEPELVADFANDYYVLEGTNGDQTFGYGVANLSEIFTGYMDTMDISEGPDTCTIEMRVENKLIDLERARVARFTSGYQKSIYPGDLGLDFVESLQDRPISWGKATT